MDARSNRGRDIAQKPRVLGGSPSCVAAYPVNFRYIWGAALDELRSSAPALREPAFTSLLVDAVFKKHVNEIHSDPAFLEEIILAHCLTAPPSELRKMAVQDRKKGKMKFAYYLEVIADQRERGELA